MANSAAVVNEAPETVLSKADFWDQNYAGKLDGVIKNPKGYGGFEYWFAKNILRTRDTNRLDADYEAYLNNINNRNEAKAVQSARAWDEFMSSTAYSRAFEDMKRAGINPYLLLNSGSSPATSTGSSVKGSYDSKSSLKDTQSNNKGRDMALILLAIARLAAAL